mgnify:CR=1 FL=1
MPVMDEHLKEQTTGEGSPSLLSSKQTHLRNTKKIHENHQKNYHRKLHLDDAKNDNYWSTSLYSKPPVLTSSRCVHALREFFLDPSILSVATESSSHPTGLQAVLSQPWLYAGGGLGNIPECPLQVCLAGAGTRRDSITFASVCVPYECHAQDLAADDFPASLGLAARDVMTLTGNAQDDDDPFEFLEHPKRSNLTGVKRWNDKDPNKPWWHSSPAQQQAFAEEYITLNTRIAKLNKFLQTGWTCGSFQVSFDAFPFGVPYLVVCAALILLTLRATLGKGKLSSSARQKQQPESTDTTTTTTRVYIENDQNDEDKPLVLQSQNKSSGSLYVKSLSGTSYPTQDTQSDVSLTSDPSEASKTNYGPQNERRGNDDRQDDINHSHDDDDGGGGDDDQGNSTTKQMILDSWNAHKHWHTICTSRHEATACLDGLRVFSILWVILGHVMAIQSSTGGGYSNPVDFLPPSGLTTTFLGQLIFASRFAVDTFLVISGYLLVIVIARKAPTLLRHQKGGAYRRGEVGTFFKLIGLRLLRIFPLYLLCMGFFTQVAPHVYLVGEENDGGGPFWYQWDSLLQPCRDYGWTNLLFINNFVPFEKSNTETCFYHSWYLAVDMQLFVLFGLPVTFFIYLRNPEMGKRTTLALWCTSVLLTGYLAHYRQWSINTFDGLAVAKFDIEAYAKPHVRGQAYFAGMYVAMLQLTKTREEASFNRTTQQTTWKHRALLWGAILSLGFVTFCTVTGAYGRRPCQYTEYPSVDDCGSLWSPTATFLYTATSRAIWSCSIAVLMTLCLEGNGGWLNKFLSWPIWAPLSQLSFGTYLIHPIVIFIWLLGMRQKNVYSLATFLMSLTSVCCVSFGFALVAAVLVEYPVAALISKKIKQRSKPRTTAPAVSQSDSHEQTELIPRSVDGGYGSVS